MSDQQVVEVFLNESMVPCEEAAAVFMRRITPGRSSLILLEPPEAHGEGPGHPFRGNQWTGGFGGGQGSEAAPSPAEWSQSDPRYAIAQDAIQTAQFLLQRRDGKTNTRYKIGQFLAMPPNWRASVGPRQWAGIKEEAEEIRGILSRRGFAEDALLEAFSKSSDRDAGASRYLVEQVARLAAGGPERNAVVMAGLDHLVAIAADGINVSKAHRAFRNAKAAERNESLVEKFVGLDQVKLFATAKAAAASISDITSAGGKNKPFVSLDNADPRIASMMANELRSLHDEFPEDYAGLGHFGPRESRDRGGGGLMAVYYRQRQIHSGFKLGRGESVHKTYDNSLKGPLGHLRIFGRAGYGNGVPLPEGATVSEGTAIVFNGALFSSISKAYTAHGMEGSSDYHDGMKDIRSTVRHEFGHHIDNEAGKTGFGGFAKWKGDWFHKSAREVSGYSAKNPGEFFAESISALKYGDEKRKSHPALAALRAKIDDYKAFKKNYWGAKS